MMELGGAAGSGCWQRAPERFFAIQRGARASDAALLPLPLQSGSGRGLRLGGGGRHRFEFDRAARRDVRPLDAGIDIE